MKSKNRTTKQMHVSGGATAPLEKEIKQQLDILKLKNQVCVKCGHPFFHLVNIIKIIPGLMVGSKDDIKKVIPCSKCDNCGHVIDQDKLVNISNGKETKLIVEP